MISGYDANLVTQEDHTQVDNKKPREISTRVFWVSFFFTMKRNYILTQRIFFTIFRALTFLP